MLNITNSTQEYFSQQIITPEQIFPGFVSPGRFSLNFPEMNLAYFWITYYTGIFSFAKLIKYPSRALL